MAVVALDTHAVVKELQAAGFSEAQAEAVTRAVRRAQDVDVSHLATKTDVQALKTDIQVLKTEIDGLRTSTKADNDSLRASTKADIAELKADILKWMVGAIGVQTIAILGALVGLARVLKG